MPLNKADLEKNMADRIEGIDLVNESTNAAAEIAKIVAEEVHSYLEDFVSKYNNHTHPGVITTVSGGGGAPAIGVPGNSQPTTQKV